MSTATSSNPIAARLEQLRREIDKVQALEVDMPDIEAVREECPQLGVPIVCSDTVVLDMAATVDDMSEVAAILRAFGRRGWHQAGKPYDCIEVGERAYRLWRSGHAALRIWFGFSGESCRYVQTGTKEVPVMELRCEGGER